MSRVTLKTVYIWKLRKNMKHPCLHKDLPPYLPPMGKEGFSKDGVHLGVSRAVTKTV